MPSRRTALAQLCVSISILAFSLLIDAIQGPGILLFQENVISN